MAKYIAFNFTDCYGDNYPITVRFEEDLTHKQLMEIAKKFQKAIAKFRERGDGWDSDGELLDDVLKKFGYKYEYVVIDESIETD